jgi:hypothetical protein
LHDLHRLTSLILLNPVLVDYDKGNSFAVSARPQRGRSHMSAREAFSPGGQSLPPRPDTKHWTPSRKAEVVAAVNSGLLSCKEACDLYKMSVEELVSWQEALDGEGLSALRVHRITDRRRAARRKIHEAGAVLLNGAAVIDCVIIDISPKGARLQFGSPVAVPRRFLLRCEKNWRSIEVTRAWQRDCAVGVAFATSTGRAEAGLEKWLLGDLEAPSSALDPAEIASSAQQRQ